jgi:hypothetical protein
MDERQKKYLAIILAIVAIVAFVFIAAEMNHGGKEKPTATTTKTSPTTTTTTSSSTTTTSETGTQVTYTTTITTSRTDTITETSTGTVSYKYVIPIHITPIVTGLVHETVEAEGISIPRTTFVRDGGLVWNDETLILNFGTITAKIYPVSISGVPTAGMYEVDGYSDTVPIGLAYIIKNLFVNATVENPQLVDSTVIGTLVNPIRSAEYTYFDGTVIAKFTTNYTVTINGVIFTMTDTFVATFTNYEGQTLEITQEITNVYETTTIVTYTTTEVVTTATHS